MTYRMQAAGPATELRARRLLRTVAEELRRDLGEDRLSADLIAAIYSCIRELLASTEVSEEGSVGSTSGLVNELALAIFLVVVSSGYIQNNPSLLLTLERAVENGLTQGTTARRSSTIESGRKSPEVR